MNKYLEKISSAKILAAKTLGAAVGLGGAGAVAITAANKAVKNEQEKQGGIQDWVDDLTGKKVKHNESVMNGLRHAATSGKSYAQYDSELKGLRNATAKARVGAGAGVVGVVAAGAYGLHAYKEHQRKKILETYQKLYKQAGLGGALLEAGGKALKTGYKGLKSVGRAGMDTLNTAGGGKIKTFANTHGIAHDSTEMKNFNNASHPEKLQMLKAKLGKPGPDRKIKSKQLRGDFKKLTRDQTNARIVAGAIPAAGVVGYKKGRKAESESQAQTAYY